MGDQLKAILLEVVKPAITFVFGKTLNEFLLLVTMAAIGFIGYYELTVSKPETIRQIQEGHKEARGEFRQMIGEEREAANKNLERVIKSHEQQVDWMFNRRFGAMPGNPPPIQ